MDELDKKIKELSMTIPVPEGYDSRIEDILASLPEQNNRFKKSNRSRLQMIYAAAAVFAVLCIGTVIIGKTDAAANIFKLIGQSITEFFGISTTDDDMGIESKRVNKIVKSDITMQLQEFSMDENRVYLNVLVSAPKDVRFSEKVQFDYFGICRGDTYNPEKLLGGAKSMEYLGIVNAKNNTAQYILTLTTDEVIKDGDKLVAFFDDMTLDPNSDTPQTLIRGNWRIGFTAQNTVSSEKTEEKIEKSYPFLGKNVIVKKIETSPLGVTITTDVSEFTQDEVNTSDMRIEAGLNLDDGKTMILSSRKDGVEADVDSGSISVENKGKKIYIVYSFTFKKAVKTKTMQSIYIEDVSVWEQD